MLDFGVGFDSHSQTPRHSDSILKLLHIFVQSYLYIHWQIQQQEKIPPKPLITQQVQQVTPKLIQQQYLLFFNQNIKTHKKQFQVEKIKIIATRYFVYTLLAL